MFKEEENCVRTKKKRDKKRAHFALPTTSKTPPTHAFFVSRRGVVGVAFLLATQKRRGETWGTTTLYIKIFDAIFFLSSNVVKSAARGEEETKSSSSSSS